MRAAVTLPIGDVEVGAQFTVRDRAPAQPGELLETNHRMVASDFFTTLGIDLVEGRATTANDDAESPLAVVVSRHLAEQYWPDRSPLGRQVKRGGPDSGQPWMTVVGVAENVRDSGLDAVYRNTWYVPYAQPRSRPVGCGWSYAPLPIP